MNDFQDQAKNWLRNVVKQNPDKIKAGVEKAGDLIDKQTGGKYAEKVDSVQEKVGTYVDSHAEPSQPSSEPGNTSTEQNNGTSETSAEPEPADSSASETEADSSASESSETDSSASESTEADSSAAEPSEADSGAEESAEADSSVEENVDEADPDAVDGTVVGGEAPEVDSNPSSSAGSGTEGADTGSTATGTSDGGLPGPR